MKIHNKRRPDINNQTAAPGLLAKIANPLS